MVHKSRVSEKLLVKNSKISLDKKFSSNCEPRVRKTGGKMKNSSKKCFNKKILRSEYFL